MTHREPEQGARPLLASHLHPGDWVVHPDRPDWGSGQVQSVVGPRVTVNFEHAGKVMVNVQIVALALQNG